VSTNPFDETEAWEPYLDKYISEEGNYVFTIVEAEDATSQTSKMPQLFLQLEAREGKIRDWVNYRHDEEKQQLDKVLAVYKAAEVQTPQEGEFDPADHCRLSSGCIARLVGRKVGGVVRLEDSFKDPTKQVLRIQGYVPSNRITDDMPADTANLPDVGAAAAANAGGSDDLDIPF